MLYLCAFLPLLPLEARQPPTEQPTAIAERSGSRRWLIACNDACRPAGITPGLDATTALTLYPSLHLVERSPAAELAAIKGLAAWAEQFSHWVCFDAERLLLWIEIRSGLRYFGGLDEIRSRVDHGLVQLGHQALLGIAPTLEAAALLSRLDNAPVVHQSDRLNSTLRPLPMDAMELPDETLQALAGLGLRTVGDILALPRAATARRFNPELIDYLDRLSGTRPDPRKPYRAPATYRRRFELLGVVDNSEGLLFPLRRMFLELQGYLVARDTAVSELYIDLAHDGGDQTTLELRTTRPIRDAARLFALVRERLERVQLDRAVEEIILRAERFQPLGDTQLELIDGGRRQDQGWDELLDRLRARLGDAAVNELGLQDHHLPEQAWCTVARPQAPVAEPLPDRPLWLVQPRRLSRLPQRLGKPERIEAGWWTGNDQRRDYYTAQGPDGSRLWLYRDADRGTWYLHGLWA